MQAAGRTLADLESWTELFTVMKKAHGDDGVWATFEMLRDKHKVHLLLQDSARELRDIIVNATVMDEKRIDALLGVATRLRAFQQEWPDLYGSSMAALLRKAEYVRAIDCHHRLAESLRPNAHALAGLLSNFILDPSEDMQSCLRTIYNFSPCRNLYDCIIPSLYDAGYSRLARDWRGLFLRSNDKEASEACRPFIQYLADFYPLIRLSKQEESVLRGSSTSQEDFGLIDAVQTSTPRDFRDEFVAKTFATSWISLDFAINTIQRLGLTKIGARALQAVALREGNAEGLAARISQFEKLGLEVSSQAYCKALIMFARSGEDELLQQLLECDIHPNEFDTLNSRRVMMETSKERKLRGRITLLHAVDWAVENEASQLRLNRLLRDVIPTYDLGKIMQVIVRMDALKISMTQRNAELLLRYVFKGISVHKHKALPRSDLERYKRVVILLRRLLQHDVGIPIDYWRYVLYMLGRLGRFEELLQLALELVGRFTPTQGGLIPMHPRDRPTNIKSKAQSRSRASTKLSEDMQEEKALVDDLKGFASTISPLGSDQDLEFKEDIYRIPSDLPFSHRQHPLNKIFDDKLQRAIVRWGFDQTLLKFPTRKIVGSTRLRDYDVVLGVRILALLHDKGVLITKDVIRSALAQRTVMAQLPKRRHRARDSNETSTATIKQLADKAWGPELLRSLEDFEQRVAGARKQAWKRGSHSIEFQNAHDPLAEETPLRGASRKHDNLAKSLERKSEAGSNPKREYWDKYWRHTLDERGRALDYQDAYHRAGCKPRTLPAPQPSEDDHDLRGGADASDEFYNRFTRKWRGPQW